jgi:hypothetical protein
MQLYWPRLERSHAPDGAESTLGGVQVQLLFQEAWYATALPGPGRLVETSDRCCQVQLSYLLPGEYMRALSEGDSSNSEAGSLLYLLSNPASIPSLKRLIARPLLSFLILICI